MGIGEQFSTIIYYEDTGEIRTILPNRYIHSRKDLNFLIDLPESKGIKFFYVPGYFPLDAADWVVSLGSALRSPRLVSHNGTNGALLIAKKEAIYLCQNFKRITFHFEGGMGDYIDQADVMINVRHEYPQKDINLILDGSRIDALKMLEGFRGFSFQGSVSNKPGLISKINFSDITKLCGEYLPNGKIGAYSLIGGLSEPAVRAKLIVSQEQKEKAQSLISGLRNPETKFVIGLHTVSGNSNTKSIQNEFIVKCLRKLLKDKSYLFLQLGGAGETDINHKRIISLQGKMNWCEVFSLINSLDGCICIDSAILHIATHAGIPCMGIFGPTEPINIFGQDKGFTALVTDRPCRGCNRYECAPCFCMKEFNQVELNRTLRKFESEVKRWKVLNTLTGGITTTPVTGTLQEISQATQTCEAL